MLKGRILFVTLGFLAGFMIVPAISSALDFKPAAGSPLTTIGTSPNYGFPWQTASADFNNDGNDDLAFSTQGQAPDANGIDIKLSNGDGTFTTMPTVGALASGGGYVVRTGDFNNDNKADLLYYTVATDSKLKVFLGNGDGTFGGAITASYPFPSGGPGQPNSVVVGQFNGDSNLDVAIGQTGNFTIFLGDGNGNLSSTGPFQVTGAGKIDAAATGDYNGDGKPDLAFSSGNALFVTVGDGLNGWTQKQTENPGDSPVSPGTTVGDIDSLATVNMGSDASDDLASSALDSNGGPQFTNPGTIQTWKGVASGAVALRRNDDPGGSITSDNKPANVISGDFDNDGKPDLAWSQFLTPNAPPTTQLAVAKGDGSDHFALFTGTPPDGGSPFDMGEPEAGPRYLAAGDFNGDGALDVTMPTSISPGKMVVAMNAADPTTDVGSISYSDTQVGSANSRPVTIINRGGPAVTVTGLTLDGPDLSQFEITPASHDCYGSLPPTETCPIGVRFLPTSTGLKTGLLRIDFANGVPSITLDLYGKGTQAQALFDPATPDFGEVVVGTTSDDKTVTVTNSGDAPLVIGQIAKSTDDDSGSFNLLAGTGDDTCSNQTIAAGDDCAFKVNFAPQLAFGLGDKSLNIEVPSNDPDSGDQQITVHGNATNPGVNVDPTNFDFGGAEVGGVGQGHQFILNSTGTTPLVIGDILVQGPDSADFRIGSSTCPTSLPVGQACTFYGIFSPEAGPVDARSATLVVDSNAADLNIPVTGTATHGDTLISPDPVAFGDVKVGTASATKTVTLTANGTASLYVDSVTLAGADPDQYEITDDECSPVETPPGGSCEITVRFNPDSIGQKSSDLTVDTVSHVVSTQLTGNGIDPAGSLTPASHDFGSVTVDSSSATAPITVKSTGSTPLKVTSASITGTDASSYKLANATACNGTQATTCDLSVTFSPTGSAGPRSATLSVVTDAGTLTSALTGTAAVVTPPPVVIPKASLSLKAAKKVKKGKKLVVTARVKGLSAGAIAGITVATKVSGPGKAPKKVKISSLVSGTTKTLKIKIPVKKSAKPGKKLAVTVTVTAGGKKLASKKVKSTIKK